MHVGEESYWQLRLRIRLYCHSFRNNLSKVRPLILLDAVTFPAPHAYSYVAGVMEYAADPIIDDCDALSDSSPGIALANEWKCYFFSIDDPVKAIYCTSASAFPFYHVYSELLLFSFPS